MPIRDARRIDDLINVYGSSRIAQLKQEIKVGLKPYVFEILSDDEIDEAIDNTKCSADSELIIAAQLDDNFSNPFCTQCGKCCEKSHPIGLTNEDVALLAKGFNESIGRIVRKYTRPAKRPNSTTQFYLKHDRPCEFFNTKTHHCRIYQYRPNMCRYYPMQLWDPDKHVFLFDRFCDVPLNYFKYQAKFEIMMAFMKKDDPLEYEKMRQQMEAARVDISHLPAQERISIVLEELRRVKHNIRQ